MIQFSHVTKQFDGTAALKDLNLTIDDGEFLCWSALLEAARQLF